MDFLYGLSKGTPHSLNNTPPRVTVWLLSAVVFDLVINNLIQHSFLRVLFCVVHFLRPAERGGSFEFFCDAALFYQPGESEVDLPLCLLLGFVEVLIERARGEKRGVGAAAVLFEIVEAHSAVLADGVVGLLGESQVGIHNAVSFCVSELHNSSSVIQYFLHSHSTIFALKRRMCGMAFSFTLSRFATKFAEKKYFLGSGQISRFRVGYRVRRRPPKSLGSFDQVIFKGRNSPLDVVWLKINRTTLTEESGMGQNDPYHSVRTFCPRGKMNTAPIIEDSEAPREAGRKIIQNILRN